MKHALNIFIIICSIHGVMNDFKHLDYLFKAMRDIFMKTPIYVHHEIV